MPLPPAFGPVPLAGVPGRPTTVARWVAPGAVRAALGQAAPGAIDQERLEVESAVRDLAVELELRAQRLEGEFFVAQDDALRPGIPFIGKEFRIGEAMASITFAARALEDIAKSVLTGPLAGYVSMEANRILGKANQTLFGIWSNAEPRSEPIAEGHESLAEEHLLSYSEDLKELRDAAERLMVSAENGKIPIREPGEEEQKGAAGVLLSLGILAAGGLLVYFVASA